MPIVTPIIKIGEISNAKKSAKIKESDVWAVKNGHNGPDIFLSKFAKQLFELQGSCFYFLAVVPFSVFKLI